MMERTLNFLTPVIDFFNEFIYHALREKLAPLVPYVFPRFTIQLPRWLKLGQQVEFITANQITIGRTIMSIPVALLVYYEYYIWGFTLYVIAGLLDFVDGLVATTHRKLGFKDSLDLGEFLDAFCDKIFYIAGLVLTLLIILILIFWVCEHEPTINIGFLVFLFIVSFFSVACELDLAKIRVQDYRYNRINCQFGRRDLKAKGAGKLKLALQLIGLGGIILSLPTLDHWSFYVGLTCLTLSLPFGLASRKQKLRQRQYAL